MDVEKTVQFILDQQAAFASGLEQLRENQATFASGLEQLREQQATFATEVRQNYLGLVEVQTRQQTMINQLIGTVGQLTEKVQDIADKLDALIKVVDDLVRRDGRPS